MPYSKQHKQQSKEKILLSAVELFSRKGYANVSIDDLMEHAKLTRGAFYNHFKSKSDVYNHAITAAARNSMFVNDIPTHLPDEEWLPYFINGYLSAAHVRQECSPCPMAFLVTDVSNSEPMVKKTYTEVFKNFCGLVKKYLHCEADDKQQQALAMAISALVIGSVAIGRALDDEVTQQQLLDNSKRIALELASGKLFEPA